MNQTERELYQLLTGLASRYATFWGPVAVGCDTVAQAVVDELLNGDAVTAKRAAQAVRYALVSTTDSSFWATSLGKLVFARGGYPGSCVSQTQVADILGVSRQRVGQLVSDGTLLRYLAVPSEVTVDSVQELLLRRLSLTS